MYKYETKTKMEHKRQATILSSHTGARTSEQRVVVHDTLIHTSFSFYARPDKFAQPPRGFIFPWTVTYSIMCAMCANRGIVVYCDSVCVCSVLQLLHDVMLT